MIINILWKWLKRAHLTSANSFSRYGWFDLKGMNLHTISTFAKNYYRSSEKCDYYTNMNYVFSGALFSLANKCLLISDEIHSQLEITCFHQTFRSVNVNAVKMFTWTVWNYMNVHTLRIFQLLFTDTTK